MKVLCGVSHTPTLAEMSEMILNKTSFFLMPQKKDVLSYLKLKQDEISAYEEVSKDLFLSYLSNQLTIVDLEKFKGFPKQFFPKSILDLDKVEEIGPHYALPANYDHTKNQKLKIVDLSTTFMRIYMVFDYEQNIGYILSDKIENIDVISLIFESDRFSNY